MIFFVIASKGLIINKLNFPNAKSNSQETINFERDFF